jgi:drug/metabolite transporter (DMT)-like permease
VTEQAFALVILSAVVHAGWNLAARRVSGDFGVLWLALVCAAVLGAPLMAWRWDAGTTDAWPLLALTGIINAVYFIALAKAYERGGLSEVYPAARGSGVAGAALLSSLVLKERLGAAGAAGVACVLAGILLSRPPAGPRHPKGNALPWALLAGACIAASGLIDKTAMRTADPAAYLVGLFAGGALFSAPYAWTRRAEQCRAAWRGRKLLSAGIGLASAASYGLVLAAFRTGPLGLVAALRESSVLFGTLLGVVLLGERPSALRLSGVGAILAGLVLIRLA